MDRAIVINSFGRSGSNILANMIGSSPIILMAANEFWQFYYNGLKLPLKIYRRLRIEPGKLVSRSMFFARRFQQCLYKCIQDSISTDYHPRKERGSNPYFMDYVIFTATEYDMFLNSQIEERFNATIFIGLVRIGYGLCDSWKRSGAPAKMAGRIYGHIAGQVLAERNSRTAYPRAAGPASMRWAKGRRGEGDMLPKDLPGDLPSFLARFGSDEQCRCYLFAGRWPAGFRCAGCGHDQAWALRSPLVYECAACGKQHSLLAGTIFEQTETGLARWFLAIFLVTSSKGGIAATKLQRQMGFGNYQTAWSWLHKIRRAMVAPGRLPLAARVEADETYVGGPRPGRSGRGAAGKTRVAGAVESGRGKARGRRLGQLRLAVMPDVSARSLAGFLATAVAKPATVTTDGWSGYGGLAAAGYRHEPVNLAACWGDASLRLPAIHLVFGLAERWLLGTHHDAVGTKHLPADPGLGPAQPDPGLDEFVFRFNRRTAKSISHRFARLVEHAVQIQPTTYRALVATPA